ncbi:hypothetical protein [Marinospirillum perlucidum]|uniref:hypothetical protein n=1 Tax=Marinospirillum perlucidum TaxID=1982602 RepID=UPI000DF476D7|nr:hypothetical protein [Marinospirillum perlucidum]
MTTSAPSFLQKIKVLFSGKAQDSSLRDSAPPSKQAPEPPVLFHSGIPLQEAAFSDHPAAQFEKQLMHFLSEQGWLENLIATSGTNSRYWIGLCPERQEYLEISLVAAGYNTAAKVSESTAWMIRIGESASELLAKRLQDHWNKNFTSRSLSGKQRCQFVFKQEEAGQQGF